MICTRCDGTGFLNLHQIPEDKLIDNEEFHDRILVWIRQNPLDEHDVRVCDCCGNGKDWYGEPGKHYGPDDPLGSYGPYAYNGGLCECN